MNWSSNLCAPFLSALPVQHAAICTLGTPFEVETVCSSDLLAARLDEAQLDLGEGPCWQARAAHAPVLVPNLDVPVQEWPVLRVAILAAGVRSAYAFPLSVGSLDIGAVDLYSSAPDALSPDHVAEAAALADMVAIQVLHEALAHVDDPPDEGPTSRRVVHQATGMVMAQLGLNPSDALSTIRAHAFATNRSVREVATDITARRTAFPL